MESICLGAKKMGERIKPPVKRMLLYFGSLDLGRRNSSSSNPPWSPQRPWLGATRTRRALISVVHWLLRHEEQV